MGQVTATDKQVDAVTYTTQTTYDGLGRVLNLTYPDNSTVTHTYNGPQLEKVGEGTTTYASYGGFNAQGQPSTLTLGNGVITTYTYDPNNYRLKTLKTVKGATTLQDFVYTFDAGGNVTGLTDPQQGNQTFTYDGLERLITAVGTYGTLTYGYDQIGNLTSNSRNGGTYTYPTSGSSSVRPHAVSTAGGDTYAYDANGNMISGAGRTITYDYENRPVSITKNGSTTTMVYDGDGGRVKKTVNDGSATTTTTYIGKLYVCEGSSCAKMIFSGSQRIAMKQAIGTVDYFHPDHLGSTSVFTNSTGVAEQELAYYPYGETRVNSGGSNSAVEEWKLDVGTFAGGNDLYQSSGLGQQTSTSVSNLPTDGSQVYVTLSYKVGGVWDHDDYVYTASSGGGGSFPPPINSPAPGSTLTTTSVTFTGDHTSQDAEHWLYVGTTGGTGAGANDLYDSGSLGTGHTATATGLPTSGTIYVQWWSKPDGAPWEYQEHTYTMNVGGSCAFPPPITSPSPGSTLTTTSATFTACHSNSEGGDEAHWLYVGSTSVGSKDILDSGNLGAVHTQTVTGLPTSGTLYVRWYAKDSSGTWDSTDQTYTMSVGANQAPDGVINTPVVNQTINVGGSVSFTGTATDPDANLPLTHLWNFGAGSGITDAVVEDPGAVTFNTAGVFTVTYTVTDALSLADPMPATVQITVNSGSTFPPPIVTPVPGATLTSTSVTFTGDHTSQDVEHWLYVGTTGGTGAGASDLYDSGRLVGTHTATATGLPTSGTIYLQWWSKPDAAPWEYQEHTYTMNVGGGCAFPPPITSPAPGATLTTTSVTFTACHSSSEGGDEAHWLYVGTTGVGSKDILDSGNLGAVHTRTVDGSSDKWDALCALVRQRQ